MAGGEGFGGCLRKGVDVGFSDASHPALEGKQDGSKLGVTRTNMGRLLVLHKCECQGRGSERVVFQQSNMVVYPPG